MQWSLGLRDLHLGSRKAELAGTVGEPAGKEGFSAAILATDCLENTTARTDSSEFVLQRPIESFKAHRECVQAASWYGAPPQGIHDLQAALGADGHRGLLHQIELPEQQVTVELNCVRGIIAAQDRVAVDVEDALHLGEESRQPDRRKLQGPGQGDRSHLPATSIQGTKEFDEQIVQWYSASCKLLLLIEDGRADQASDPLGHRLVGAPRRPSLVLGLKIEQHTRRSWLGGLECDGRLLGWCQSGDWLVPPRRGVNRKFVPAGRIRFGT